MKPFVERVLAAALVIGVVIAIAYAMRLFLLVLGGILLAILLRTAGEWLSRTVRVSIGWAMASVVVTFLGLLFGTAWEFGATVAGEADQLFIAVSHAFINIQEQASQYKGLHQLLTQSSVVNLVQPAQTAASGAFWIAGVLILVLFVGVYVAISPELYVNLFLSLFSRPLRSRVGTILDELGSALRWWLFGQLIAMAVVGLITMIGLEILGIPMALPLAAMAALLTFIPYIGPLISAVPAVLIALTLGSHSALYVLLVYSIAHIVEGYILVPTIQHRFVHLPPALILASQFLADRFLGTTGVALATPVLVVAMVLMNRLYFHQDWETTKAA